MKVHDVGLSTLLAMTVDFIGLVSEEGNVEQEPTILSRLGGNVTSTTKKWNVPLGRIPTGQGFFSFPSLCLTFSFKQR